MLAGWLAAYLAGWVCSWLAAGRMAGGMATDAGLGVDEDDQLHPPTPIVGDARVTFGEVRQPEDGVSILGALKQSEHGPGPVLELAS